MSETKTKNLCTVPAADLTDNQYFIAEDGGELKRIPKAQVVLKKLEKMLATDTENLAGGGEVTAQELLDALAEQVANKLLAKSQVVNNLLATVEGNPLDATQGKALKTLIDTTNNNLSNAGIPTVKKITDLYDIKKSGFYYYDAGATNAPMSSRGGMIVANYLSDSWISLTVVPYASSKIYTNTKYNNTWVGWAESATKDDLTKSIDFRGNAKTFKVRSGETGLKNIYLDIGDEAGNSCSLGFFSDKENSIRLILNNQVVWTK